MKFSLDRSPRKWPVLSIGTDLVEWFEGGDAPRYLSAEVDEPTPVRMGRAAADLLRENEVSLKEGRLRRRTCTLMLGQGLLEHGTVSIAELAAKDSKRVLHRKAANMISASLSETLFTAIPLAQPEAVEGEESGVEWLILAMRRRDARALQVELRRQGFKIGQVISSRLAKVAAAATIIRDEDDAMICVGAGRNAVTISLVHGSELVQTVSLSGGYSADPNMAASLLQGLRGFEAFWRKRSRGGSLSRVVLLGFTHEQATQLSPAIHASLPSTQVEVFPSAELDGLPVDRVSVLQSAWFSSDLQVDLSLPLMPRAKRLAAMALAVCAIAAGMAWRGRGQIIDLTASHQRQVAHLYETTADADELEAKYTAVDDSLMGLEAERERQQELGMIGMDLSRILPATLAAFSGLAAPLTMRIDASDIGGEAIFTGVTASDPGRSLQALRILAARLENSPHFEEVYLLPPTGMPTSENGESPLLEFAVEAFWEGPE